jgi:hypothetical protein
MSRVRISSSAPLLDLVRSGTAPIPTPDRRTARIHRDDAATAIVHVATMQARPADTYLVVDDAPAPYGEVIRWLADAMDAPAPQPAAGPSNRGADRACSNARLRDTGWTPTFPTYAEGYRAILNGQARATPRLTA